MAEMQTLGMGFTWEQLSVGQRFRTLNRTLTEADLMMFVGVTGMVEVIFTDPGAKPDLEAWCRATGNPLLGFREARITSSAFVRKGASWKK